jgi:two-component system, OmpR family, response regulator
MRVLVADDDPVIRVGVASLLEDEGFSVVSVDRGDDAVTALRLGGFRAAVLDVMMPAMSGYAVCRAVRTEGIWTPVLLLTAKQGEFDEAEAFELGADDFLSKPFSAIVLKARVRSLVRIGERSRSEIIVFGDVELDPVRHSCTVRGGTLHLTVRERELMTALLQRRGDVVEKQRLFDEVWGGDHPASIAVVEVYVGYLRRKLNDAGSSVGVRSVRGVGYRVEESCLE